MSSTLLEKVEECFEKNSKREPKTLAEAVSNELIAFLPRVSLELFQLRRKANLKLTKDQVRFICDKYLHITPFVERKGDTLYLAENATLNTIGEIPQFAYSIVPTDNPVIFEKSAQVFANVGINISTSGRKDTYYDDIALGHTDKDNANELIDSSDMVENKKLRIYNFPGIEEGFTTLKIDANWTSPFKLDLGVKVPEIPESSREIGDEGIALYYQHALKVPKYLRKSTSLISPKIGVLWAPTDESLHIISEIPTPKISFPLPKRDPLMILDIPDGNRSYMHVLAAWNIGDELPFKNYIAEYTEGGIKL